MILGYDLMSSNELVPASQKLNDVHRNYSLMVRSWGFRVTRLGDLVLCIHIRKQVARVKLQTFYKFLFRPMRTQMSFSGIAPAVFSVYRYSDRQRIGWGLWMALPHLQMYISRFFDVSVSIYWHSQLCITTSALPSVGRSFHWCTCKYDLSITLLWELLVWICYPDTVSSTTESMLASSIKFALKDKFTSVFSKRCHKLSLCT